MKFLVNLCKGAASFRITIFFLFEFIIFPPFYFKSRKKYRMFGTDVKSRNKDFA